MRSIEASLLPWHDAFTESVTLTKICAVVVIVADAVAVQLLASVTVTVYDPGGKSVAVESEPPIGDHE